MAMLHRGNSNRFASTIWPGYVDAMTTLLMVLIFVLTIFIVVQSMLRERITDQDGEIAKQEETLTEQQTVLTAQEQRLVALGNQVADLAAALSVSEQGLQTETAKAAALASELADAETAARDRAAQIARLGAELQASRTTAQARASELESAQSRLTDFEAEVAALLAARDTEQAAAAAAQQQLSADLSAATDRASVAELAVAAARDEIDAQAEQARLAAARRDALQALVADLRARSSGDEAKAGDLQTRLTEAEAARLAEAEAAQLLRDRLATSDAELTAMTLSLEESRRNAAETLTLLAAAETARDQLTDDAKAAAARLTEAEAQAATLAVAQAELAKEQELSAEGQRRVALLNEQVASLTGDLGRLQSVLEATGEGQTAAELRVEDLGQQLNAALLLAAEEKDRRLTLEEQARQRAEDEAKDLARYRSEFFGRLSQILEGRQGVNVVGDRFVFDSSVLFDQGEATLSDAGKAQIRNVADMLSGIAGEIPPEIDWIIRVDGHTDNLPLSGSGRYRDNWELSQARALAVVRYMTEDLGFPSDRLAPAGFADTRPVATENTPEGRAQNRRIELKLTER